MGDRKRRMQMARFMAMFYVVFLVCSDVLQAGIGMEQSVYKTHRYSGGYAISLEQANKDTLFEEAGCSVTVSNVGGENRQAEFTLNIREDGPNRFLDKMEVYSVQYNGKDYYATGRTDYDGTTPGLYYNTAAGKWRFAFPQAITASTQLKIRVAFDFGYTSATSRYARIYDASYQESQTAGQYSNLELKKFEDLFANALYVKYYDYTGKVKTSYYAKGGTTNETAIGPEGLKLQYQGYKDTIFRYDLLYGSSAFWYYGQSKDIVQVAKYAQPVVTAERVQASNRVVFQSNLDGASAYVQVSRMITPDNKEVTIPSQSEEGQFAYFDGMQVSNNATSLSGNLLEYPKEGLLIPAVASGRNSLELSFGAANGSTAKVTKKASFGWKAPGKVELGTVETGTQKNAADYAYYVKPSNGDTIKTDVLGKVVQVNGTAVTQDKPYIDEYVSIDASGKVKALKGNGKKTYNLVTQTQYVKLKKWARSDGYTEIRYDDGTEEGTSQASRIQYGTQNWNVTLNMTLKQTTTQAPTTQKPATTTQAPTTQKPATTTQAPTTQKPATTTQAPTTQKPATTTQTPTTTQAPTTQKPATTTQAPTTQKPATTTQAPTTQKPATTTQQPRYAVNLSVHAASNAALATMKVGGKVANSISTLAGTRVEVTVKSNDMDIEPVVQYRYAGKTVVLSPDAVEETSSHYQFTMPQTNVSVEVYYHSIQSVQVTGNGIANGSVKDYGNLPPTLEQLASLCSAQAVYADARDLQNVKKRGLVLTAEDVEQAAATYTDAGTVRTYTVPVTVRKTYAGKTGSFTFSYRYQIQRGHAVQIQKTPAESAGNVTLSADNAAAGTHIIVTASNSETAQADQAYMITDSTRTALTKNSETANATVYTFTMPDADVQIQIYYNTLQDFTVKAPEKTQYSEYTRVENLDLTGAELQLQYKKSGDNTILTKKVPLSDATVSLGEKTAQTVNGTTTYRVPVQVVYGGITKKEAFYYTYQEVEKYTVETKSGEGQPVISSDHYTAAYSETVTITVPQDGGNQYAYPSLSVQSEGHVVAVTKQDETTYTFVMPAGNVSVTADYKKIQKIVITPPQITQTFDGYQEEAQLPVTGTVTAWYQNASGSQEKELAMTTDMYTIDQANIQRKKENGKVQVTVPVVITVTYGGLTQKSEFSYTYSYEDAGHAITVSNVVPAALQSKVAISQEKAVAGTKIQVIAQSQPEYAFAAITVKTETGKEVVTGVEKAEFTMPDEEIRVSIAYENIKNLTISKMPKVSYDNYVEADALDLSGGELTADYGSGQKQVLMQDNPAVTVSCGEVSSQGTVDGTTIYEVPVTVGYAGKQAQYIYTYRVVNQYRIQKEVQPQEEKRYVAISSEKAAFGKTVTVTLLENEEQEYAYPVVTVTNLYTNEAVSTGKEGEKYTFVMPDSNVKVSVTYMTLKDLSLQLPKETVQCDGYKTPQNLAKSAGTVTAVYQGAGQQKTVQLPVTAEMLSYGTAKEETRTTDQQEITIYTVPVAVTVTYGNHTAKGTFQYTYQTMVDINSNAPAITLQTLPVNLPQENAVQVSAKRANIGTKIYIYAPDSEQYIVQSIRIISQVKLAENQTREMEYAATKEGDQYTFNLLGDSVVKVTYLPLSKVEISVPQKEVSVKQYTEIADLDISNCSAKAIYQDDTGKQSGSITRDIPLKRSQFSLDKESILQEEGSRYVTHKVPVLLMLEYGGRQYHAQYAYQYQQYRIVVKTNLPKAEDATKVSAVSAMPGDTITVTPASGRLVDTVQINKLPVPKAGEGYQTTLTEAMLTQEGFVVTVQYQLPCSIAVQQPVISLSKMYDKVDKIADLDFEDYYLILYYRQDLSVSSKILLNSPEIKKEITGVREEDAGSYIRRLYTVLASVTGKKDGKEQTQTTEFTVEVKVAKKATAPAAASTAATVGKTTGATANNAAQAVRESQNSPFVPGIVPDVKVTAKKKQIVVTWGAVKEAQSYEVYICDKAKKTYQKAGTVKAAQQGRYRLVIRKYNGKKLVKNRKYYIKVRAAAGSRKLVTTQNVRKITCKKNVLPVKVPAAKNGVSYVVSIAKKQSGPYKKAASWKETGKKNYVCTLKKCGGSRLKKGSSYYVRIAVTADAGTVYGPFHAPKKVTCK